MTKVYLLGSYDHSDLFNTNFSYSNLEGQLSRSQLLGTTVAPRLIMTETENISISSSYKFSPKLSISTGLNLSDEGYSTYADQLSTKKTRVIPFHLSYKFSNKLSFVYGLTLSEREVGERVAFYRGLRFLLSPYDTRSSYYSFGLKGSILPKLTGQFDVGYRKLSFSTSSNDLHALGATSALTWSMTPKLSTSLKLNRDFDASGSGSTHRFTSGDLSAIYTLNNEYKLSLNLGRNEKYFKKNSARRFDDSNREETITNIAVDLHYVPTENYSFIIGYNTIESNAIDDYKLGQFKFTANLRY